MRRMYLMLLLTVAVLLIGGIVISRLNRQTSDSRSAEQQFMQQMIARDEGAIQMSQLAASQAQNNEIKRLADGVIANNKAEIWNLKRWYKRWWGVEVPTIVVNPHSGHSAEPTRAIKTFDQGYLVMMVSHHQNSIGLAEAVMHATWHREIQEFAETETATDTKQINQMRWLQQEVQNEDPISVGI